VLAITKRRFLKWPRLKPVSPRAPFAFLTFIHVLDGFTSVSIKEGTMKRKTKRKALTTEPPCRRRAHQIRKKRSKNTWGQLPSAPPLAVTVTLGDDARRAARDPAIEAMIQIGEAAPWFVAT
jgi:hypothetical protein